MLSFSPNEMEYQLSRSVALLSALIAVLALACGSSGGDEGGSLRVTATTTQIGDFARQVGGDRIALTVLLKPNQDAHDFEPEPSQIRAIAEADLVLRNGIGLDTFVSRALGNSKAEAVIVTSAVELHAGHTHGDDAGSEEAAAGDEAAGHDPHVWLSVANAKLMVAAIRDAFARADSANASFYSENASRYLSELDRLDGQIRSAVASLPAACRKLVTNHDVLGYYADAYGFTIAGSVIPGLASDAQPSAADVADVVRKIKAEQVPAIFTETSVNPALVRQVARESGVKVVDDLYGDSLGPRGSEADTYVRMMEANTRKIVGALQGCGA